MKIRPDKALRFSQLLGWSLFALTGWATLTAAAPVTLTTAAPVTMKPQAKVQTQTKAKSQTIGPVQTTNCTASSATLSLPSTIYIPSSTLATGVLPYPAGTATIVFTCVGLPATTSHPADYEAQIQGGDTLATLSTSNVPAGPGIIFALPKLNGLALLVTATPVQATSQACLACGPASTAGYVPGVVIAPQGTAQGTYSGTVTATYTAQLYRTTGTIKAGTQPSINLIPFWWYISGGSVDSSSALLNANLVMPAITVVASTCNITSPTVTLPPISTRALQAGQVAGSTAFSITMTGCQSGSPDAVSVFSGSGIDTTTGYLTNTGTATNVEVQLLNGAGSTSQTAGTPILLNQSGSAQNSGIFNITSGNATLNYYAQYVATNAAAAGAGTVKSTVAFTIYYP